MMTFLLLLASLSYLGADEGIIDRQLGLAKAIHLWDEPSKRLGFPRASPNPSAVALTAGTSPPMIQQAPKNVVKTVASDVLWAWPPRHHHRHHGWLPSWNSGRNDNEVDIQNNVNVEND